MSKDRVTLEAVDVSVTSGSRRLPELMRSTGQAEHEIIDDIERRVRKLEHSPGYTSASIKLTFVLRDYRRFYVILNGVRISNPFDLLNCMIFHDEFEPSGTVEAMECLYEWLFMNSQRFHGLKAVQWQTKLYVDAGNGVPDLVREREYRRRGIKK